MLFMSARWVGRWICMGDDRRIWTVLIVGPTPVIIRAPGNPTHYHHPPQTLAQVFSTYEQVKAMVEGLGAQGVQGTIITPIDKEGLFPECARCIWLDRDLGVCSEGRPGNSTLSSRGEELVELNPVAGQHWEQCPGKPAESPS